MLTFLKFLYFTTKNGIKTAILMSKRSRNEHKRLHNDQFFTKKQEQAIFSHNIHALLHILYIKRTKEKRKEDTKDTLSDGSSALFSISVLCDQNSLLG